MTSTAPAPAPELTDLQVAQALAVGLADQNKDLSRRLDCLLHLISRDPHISDGVLHLARRIGSGDTTAMDMIEGARR